MNKTNDINISYDMTESYDIFDSFIVKIIILYF